MTTGTLAKCEQCGTGWGGYETCPQCGGKVSDKIYRICIVVEEIDPPRSVPHLLQRDTIGRYQTLPQALRIAREIA